MTDPVRVQRVVTRALLFASAAGVLYLFWRFDTLVLPADACSPLWQVNPGSRLVFDRRPARLAPGDVVLFAGPAGERRLAEVAEPPEGRIPAGEAALWLVTERADCPSPDSHTLGPVGRERVVGRLVLSLPW